MTDLERRYLRLLRLYPEPYRRARSAEMLAVLLESAAPDRRWPAPREWWALLTGALRVRAGAAGRRTPLGSGRIALHVAALLMLVQGAINAATYAFAQGWEPTDTPIVAFSCLAGVAVLRHRYLGAALVAATAFAIDLVPQESEMARGFVTAFGQPYLWNWEMPLAVLLLLPLIGRGRVTPPRPLYLAALLPLLPILSADYGTLVGEAAFQSAGRLLWQLLAAAALVWAVVDERVTLTLGLVLLVQVAESLGQVGAVSGSAGAVLDYLVWTQGIWLLMPAVLLPLSLVVARRRARL